MGRFQSLVVCCALGLVSLSMAQAADFKVSVPVLSGLFDTRGEGRGAAALTAVFKACGNSPRFVKQRWGQHWQAFEDDSSYDAVAIVWDGAGVSGFPSDTFIHQRNGVVFRSDKDLDIQTLDDLAGLRVLGFGGATELFADLARVIPTMQSYWEAAPGFDSRRILVRGDADVFITDGLIFAIDYMDQVKKNGATYGDTDWPAMTFVSLFPKLGDKLHFRRADDRDAFNRCLKTAQQDGTIARVTKPFVDPYRMIVGDEVPEY
jgi:ABC-type amino acid transport substrate-binding protein